MTKGSGYLKLIIIVKQWSDIIWQDTVSTLVLFNIYINNLGEANAWGMLCKCDNSKKPERTANTVMLKSESKRIVEDMKQGKLTIWNLTDYYRSCTTIRRHNLDQRQMEKIGLEAACMRKNYRISWIQIQCDSTMRFVCQGTNVI